jgi:hypothetical protein
VGGAAAQEPVQLLEDAWLGALGDLAAVPDQRRERDRLDGEVEPRGELHRAQHAHRVLAEPDVRVADGANQAALEVGHAGDVVDHALGLDVVEQAVDGEVAPAGVLGVAAEDVVPADQELVVVRRVVTLARVGAEGRRLDDLRPEEDVSQPEPASDDAAIAEQLPDFFWSCARRDVEVLRRPVEQQIADASADEVGLEPVSREAPDHLVCIRVDELPRDAHVVGTTSTWGVARQDAAEPQSNPPDPFAFKRQPGPLSGPDAGQKKDRSDRRGGEGLLRSASDALACGSGPYYDTARHMQGVSIKKPRNNIQ